jgi:hypothetical protein
MSIRCHKESMVYFQFKAYSQSRYPKGWSIKKRIAKDYFGFLLHYSFMIIVDWYMTIIRVMSFNLIKKSKDRLDII